MIVVDSESTRGVKPCLFEGLNIYQNVFPTISSIQQSGRNYAYLDLGVLPTESSLLKDARGGARPADLGSSSFLTSTRWGPYVETRIREMAQQSPLAGDGYPTMADFKRALEWLPSLLDAETPTPSVLPGDEGGVQLVWHKLGWDIEVEILPNEVRFWGRNQASTDIYSGTLMEHWSFFSNFLTAMADG